MLRVVFKLQNVRRAPGDAGRLPGFTEIVNETENNVYIKPNGTTSPWPGPMYLVVSRRCIQKHGFWFWFWLLDSSTTSDSAEIVNSILWKYWFITSLLPLVHYVKSWPVMIVAICMLWALHISEHRSTNFISRDLAFLLSPTAQRSWTTVIPMTSERNIRAFVFLWLVGLMLAKRRFCNGSATQPRTLVSTTRIITTWWVHRLEDVCFWHFPLAWTHLGGTRLTTNIY